jgi:hypothetical protein
MQMLLIVILMNAFASLGLTTYEPKMELLNRAPNKTNSNIIS